MDSETIIITIKGVKHYFNGDELTSPACQAMIFMMKLVKEEDLF